MPVSEEFLIYVKDQLAGLGDVTSRRMFGGAGLYCQGPMFALIADDCLYLKVNDSNRPDFEARGCQPFQPFEGKKTTMNYYPVPEEVFEDRDQLIEWAEKACRVAHA